MGKHTDSIEESIRQFIILRQKREFMGDDTYF
jgi:hypothetical protein